MSEELPKADPEWDPATQRLVNEAADRLMSSLGRLSEDDLWPIDRGPIPGTVTNERPCGCRTEDGVFMPCADHLAEPGEVG